MPLEFSLLSQPNWSESAGSILEQKESYQLEYKLNMQKMIVRYMDSYSSLSDWILDSFGLNM